MVARDITLPLPPDEAWDVITDLDEWLPEAAERDAVIEESEPGERLVFWWSRDDDAAARVVVDLVAVPEGTRVSVTETFTGPMALACA